MRLPLILALLASLLLAPLARPANDDLNDQLAFEKSIDLLRLQMRLKALAMLRDPARGNMFIPPQLIKKYTDEMNDLAGSLDTASNTDLQKLQAWVDDWDTVRKAEYEGMAKLVEWAGTKFFKGIKVYSPPGGKDTVGGPDTIRTPGTLGPAEFRKAKLEWEKKVIEMKQVYTRESLLWAATWLETGLAERMADPKLVGEARDRVRIAYRETLADRNKIFESIIALEKEKQRLDASLNALKHFENLMKGLDFIQGTNVDRAVQLIQESTVAYLKSKYPKDWNSDAEKNIGWAAGLAKKIGNKTSAAWSKLSDLDSDPDLAKHPENLQIARRFAMLEAVYGCTVGIFGSFEENAPFNAKLVAPLFDVLDFYGAAVGVIPTFAQKMQKFVDRTTQGQRNVYPNDPFNVIKDGEVWETPLTNAFPGVMVGQDSLSDKAANKKFYLLVPKTIDEKLYVEMTQEEHDRLLEAVALERLIYARREASRSIYDWIMSPKDSAVSPNVASSYLSSLKKAARKSPLTPAQLNDLRQGRKALINDELESLDTLLEKFDDELETMATEAFLREAVSDYTPKLRSKWLDFQKLIETSRIALRPDQLVKLFNFYDKMGPDKLTKTLERIARERALRRQGSIKIGIPLIVVKPDLTSVKPGTKVTAEATVIVSDLAPGRQVEVAGEWMLPKWAESTRPCHTTLKNGLVPLTLDLTVPETIPPEGFEIKLKLRVPKPDGGMIEPVGSLAPSPRQERNGDAASFESMRSTGRSGVDETSCVPVSLLLTGVVAAPTTEPYIEVTGQTLIDVEVPTPGAPRIVTHRRSADTLAVEITSDSLAKLTAESGLQFGLDIAESPDGPFETISNGRDWLSGDEKMVKPDGDKSGRISKDKYLLLKRLEDKRDDGTTRHGPFYFRASQCATDADGTQASDAVYSNITRPGKAVITMSQEIKDGVIQLFPVPDQWAVFECGVGLEDQPFDLKGAEVTASSSGWKGHFYTAGGGDRVGAKAFLRVPWFPRGGAVQLEATSGAFAATLAFNLPVDQKAATYEQKRAADIRAEAPKAVASVQEEVTNRKRSLAEDEKKLAAMPAPKTFSEAHEVAKAKSSVASERASLALAEQFRLPGTPLWNERAACDAERNWSGGLRAMSRDLDLSDITFKIRADELRGEIAAEQEALASPGDSSGLRQSYQNSIAREQKELDGLTRGSADARQAILDKMATFALLAGDAAAFHSTTSQRIALMEELQWSGSVIYGIAQSYANDIAMLTGDRQQAASLWHYAWEKNIAGAPPERRDDVRKSFEKMERPAWYPSSQPAGGIKPFDPKAGN